MGARGREDQGTSLKTHTSIHAEDDNDDNDGGGHLMDISLEG